MTTPDEWYEKKENQIKFNMHSSPRMQIRLVWEAALKSRDDVTLNFSAEIPKIPGRYLFLSDKDGSIKGETVSLKDLEVQEQDKNYLSGGSWCRIKDGDIPWGEHTFNDKKLCTRCGMSLEYSKHFGRPCLR